VDRRPENFSVRVRGARQGNPGCAGAGGSGGFALAALTSPRDNKASAETQAFISRMGILRRRALCAHVSSTLRGSLDLFFLASFGIFSRLGRFLRRQSLQPPVLVILSLRPIAERRLVCGLCVGALSWGSLLGLSGCEWTSLGFWPHFRRLV